MDAPPLDVSGFGAPSPSAPAAAYTIHRTPDQHLAVPYAKRRDDDYDAEAVARRQEFVERLTGVRLAHVGRYSFDPQCTRGNIENFTGVAQVPIGFAGPLRINGELSLAAAIIANEWVSAHQQLGRNDK